MKNNFSYHFSLPIARSPTYANLAKQLQKQNWQACFLNEQADFNETHFAFYPPAAESLEFKHLLLQFCQEAMPLTYSINDQNWRLVLENIFANHYQQHQTESLVWILKPALLNNGQHIKIFQSLAQLAAHYLSAQRLGGEHVLQRYITNPHLLKGPEFGHKYSIRMFVVLTNYAGAYLYPKGYFNVALRPYQTHDFTDLRAHLTNEHLYENIFNVVQVPTEQYDLFKPFYPQIKRIVSITLANLQERYPQAFICKAQRTLAIFGFDFMVNDEGAVFLLEANHAPCFPTEDEHPLQKKLYDDFWQALISSFVLPIATDKAIDQIHYSLFEAVGFS